MNEQTVIRKSKYTGWTAETYLPSPKGEKWQFKVSTYKSQRNGVFTAAQEVEMNDTGMYSFVVYDPNYRTWQLIFGDNRATEKVVSVRHQDGLNQFKEWLRAQTESPK